jgi:hypothetical protein
MSGYRHDRAVEPREVPAIEEPDEIARAEFVLLSNLFHRRECPAVTMKMRNENNRSWGVRVRSMQLAQPLFVSTDPVKDTADASLSSRIEALGIGLSPGTLEDRKYGPPPRHRGR